MLSNSIISPKYSLLSTLLVCFFVVSLAYGQPTTSLNSPGLTYSWEVSFAKPLPEPVFILKNNNSQVLPATGWTIYFNSIKKAFLYGADTAVFQLKQVNGDLFALTAGKQYQPLAPGSSQRIRISVPDIRNYTEVPAGFYLVYVSAPLKGYLIKNTSLENNSIEPAIAFNTYQQNEKIKAIPEKELPLIFPTPVRYTRNQGSFTINAKTAIVSSSVFQNEASLFATELAGILGTKPAIITKTTANAIQLKEGRSPENGYFLTTDSKGIVITASSPEGMFYGIQSLKTLFSPKVWSAKQQSIAVQAVQVEDAPRFGHRAFMLDVARNFQPKTDILKLLDVLALYKLNTLHFHLNDDEGWRLEIPDLPELTTVGATRGHTLNSFDKLPPSYGSGPDSGNPYGSGYYTRKDFIEILKYAKARHIKVIPEIESPGHARAAIKSMDARYRQYMSQGRQTEAEEYLLRDIADKSVYRTVQGWSDNVMNPALPSTYKFIGKVTDEIVKMYQEAAAPLETIHMGGDEVPEGVWEKSPAVQRLLEKDASIKSVSGVWTYYFTQVNNILKKNYLTLYGWEEIGLKKEMINGKKRWVEDHTVANRNYQTDVWNNIIGTGAEDLAYRLANAGFKVVLSNVTNMYFDMAYNKSFNEHGMNWAGFVDVDKPFYFIPFNYFLTTTEDEYGKPVSQEVFKNKKALTAAGQQNIVGLQGALWTETVGRKGVLEYLLLPKLLGLAERAWSQKPAWALATESVQNGLPYQQAWSAFVSTAGQRELPRLDYYSGGFNYRIPEPGVDSSNGTVKANVQFPGFIIRYTTDGSEPDMNSPVYALPITAKGKITLKVFNQQGRSGKKVTVVNN